ncbi:MAG: DUF2652 domain-containing protein [Acidimicrobiia bacterium]
MEQRGFILIADITGYTRYLNRSELDHAQSTLTDLLELLVDRTRPPLVVSRLEGDAVLSYALDSGLVTPQTFIEAIEDTYVAFRRAIEMMVLNNTCRCNACANVSSLDLKFFIHHGSFMFQTVGGYQELVGSDVNLIHRLLKNTVTDRTGFGAYVLCTDAAEAALGLGDVARTTMVRHQEMVDDFGEVTVWIKDMHPVFEARKDDELISYSRDEVIDTFEIEIGLPPELVWDYLHQTEFRDTLMGSDRHEVRDRVEGRVGQGSVYQCYHGKQVLPQVVLEWRPFERTVVKQIVPVLGGPVEFLMDFGLTDANGATRLTQTLARLSGRLIRRLVVRAMVRTMHRQGLRDSEEFRRRIEADAASRYAAAITAGPVPQGRIRAAAAESLRNGG